MKILIRNKARKTDYVCAKTHLQNDTSKFPKPANRNVKRCLIHTKCHKRIPTRIAFSLPRCAITSEKCLCSPCFYVWFVAAFKFNICIMDLCEWFVNPFYFIVIRFEWLWINVISYNIVWCEWSGMRTIVIFTASANLGATLAAYGFISSSTHRECYCTVNFTCNRGESFDRMT